MRVLNKTFSVVLLCLIGLAAPVCGAGARAPYITVDWEKTHQTIVGFGGTMGWIHPHESKRKEVFDLLFTRLGVSVLRIRALGGENGDEESLEPANDNGDPARFDWSRLPIERTEALNAVIVKAAQARGVKTIIPTSWSPPGWMKSTGRRAGGGSLEPKHLDEFAELWAAYVIGMKRSFDIDVKYISLQNEPDLTYYYPTCSWEPKSYAQAMKAIEERCAREKLGVQVLGPDTCRIYNLSAYAKAMHKAGVAKGAPLLTHLYDLNIPYEQVNRDSKRWRKARKLAGKGKHALWFMETANYLSYGVESGSYEEALLWAKKVHYALVDGDCAVVCYWALFFDKRGEALLYCAKSGTKDYEITPKFYTSMNYFRFVRPGMIRCTARIVGGQGLLISAFRSAGENGPRVIVIVNPTRVTRLIQLPRVTVEKPAWKRHLTTATVHCERQAESTGGGLVNLPARSVTTLVQPARVRER